MLLKGKAIMWYRYNRRHWQFWEDFENDLKQFFLPVNLDRQFEDDIRNRTQGARENAHDYITGLQTLIRRYGKMSFNSEIDRLYMNLRPEYRRYIRRHEIRNVSDLIRLTNEFELIICTEKSYKPPPQSLLTSDHKGDHVTGTKPKENVGSIQSKYKREECCWHCGQRGHRRTNCKNPRKRFCSYCGSEGVTFLNCNCEDAGNARRVGLRKSAANRPDNRIYPAAEYPEN